MGSELTPDDRPVALFVCERAAPAVELLRVARALRDDGRVTPVLVVSAEVRAALGDELPSEMRVIGPATGEDAPAARRQSRVAALPVGRALAEGVVTARRAAADRAAARRIQDDVRPTVVVAADDRSVGMERAHLVVARGRAARVLVPFALSDPYSDEWLRRDRADLLVGGVLRRAVARRWPAQARDGRLGRRLFYSAPVVAGLAALGLLPRHPWRLGGSDADVVATVGDRERTQLITWGADPRSVVATGQPTLDDLAAAADDRSSVRAALAAELELDVQRPIVACALPHLGEHHLLTWQDHDADIEWLLTELGRHAPQVVVSLHPKADAAQYRSRIERHGLRLAERPLRTWLPAADVFVATWSSTVRWSAALGLPAIVLDHHRTGYDMYDDVEGLVVVRAREELGPALARLTSDEHARAEVAATLAGARTRFGPFDTGATGRVVELIVDAAHRRFSDPAR